MLERNFERVCPFRSAGICDDGRSKLRPSEENEIGGGAAECSVRRVFWFWYRVRRVDSWSTASIGGSLPKSASGMETFGLFASVTGVQWTFTDAIDRRLRLITRRTAGVGDLEPVPGRKFCCSVCRWFAVMVPSGRLPFGLKLPAIVWARDAAFQPCAILPGWKLRVAGRASI